MASMQSVLLTKERSVLIYLIFIRWTAVWTRNNFVRLLKQQ